MPIVLCLNAIKGNCRSVLKSEFKNRSLDFVKRHSSVLYMSGRTASKAFSYLMPQLDFDEQFSNIEALDRNLTARGMKKSATDYVKLWDFYKATAQDVAKLESKLEEIQKNIKKIYADKNTGDNKDLSEEAKQELDKYTTQLPILKSDCKIMKETLWDLDESIIGQLIKLPNCLDNKTPLDSPVILKTMGEPPNLDKENVKNHLEIGTNLGLLEYRSPMECYLQNEAVLFEMGVLSLAERILAKDEMLRIAGLDFARSLIIEASGLDHENFLHSFILTENEKGENSLNQLHLVGSASLASFLAMHAKQFIQARDLPARYFTTGRQYVPLQETVRPMGLHTVCQTSSVQTFTLLKSKNIEKHQEEFDRLVNTVCKLYDSVCNHYRLVLKPARDLTPAESMRLSFELYSPFLGEYVEVGHISTYDTYLSKRLLISYQGPAGREYPCVISGTVLSAHRLLACLLEQNPTKFSIPERVAESIPEMQM